jgi:alpha-beta hydrolase superfamily lysophospholipase
MTVPEGGPTATLARIGRAGSPYAPSVVFLHGGRPHDLQPTSSRDLPVLRVLTLARAVAWRQRGKVQVYMLRNRVRGWNDGDPVEDAQWAIREVKELRPGAPVVLVGHSMGARAALRTAAISEEVVGVVALSTWIERGDAPDLRRITAPVHLFHGSADRVTAPQSSTFVERTVTSAGGTATAEMVEGGNHSLTSPWVAWTRLVTRALDEIARATEGTVRGR